MTLFDLSGRVAIVTGGNGGIGLGMVGGLAAAGARIVVAARDRDKAEKANAELGQESSFVPFDAANESSCRGVVAATLGRFGRLDILVNNAGMSIRKPAQEYTAAEWHSVLETNLTGAFICSQAAYPVMKQAGGGKIINIGSMFSLFGAPYAVPYSVSKGGLLQLTKSLAAAGSRQHSGQCGVAGLDRHRSDPGCPAAGRGPPRASFGAHPGRALGQPRRPRRSRGIPRLRRLGFHHWRRHSRRWRLLILRLIQTYRGIR
jgi:2-deoxy-D-gluconate 3-dehydrogenase